MMFPLRYARSGAEPISVQCDVAPLPVIPPLDVYRPQFNALPLIHAYAPFCVYSEWRLRLESVIFVLRKWRLCAQIFAAAFYGFWLTPSGHQVFVESNKKNSSFIEEVSLTFGNLRNLASSNFFLPVNVFQKFCAPQTEIDPMLNGFYAIADFYKPFHD